jgi:hypothetical protein
MGSPRILRERTSRFGAVVNVLDSIDKHRLRHGCELKRNDCSGVRSHHTRAQVPNLRTNTLSITIASAPMPLASVNPTLLRKAKKDFSLGRKDILAMKALDKPSAEILRLCNMLEASQFFASVIFIIIYVLRAKRSLTTDWAILKRSCSNMACERQPQSQC